MFNNDPKNENDHKNPVIPSRLDKGNQLTTNSNREKSDGDHAAHQIGQGKTARPVNTAETM